MKRLAGRFAKSAVLASLLAGLLALLAALQVRWTRELERVERQRMEASMHQKLEGFARDFDREITRAYFAFRPAALGAPAPNLEAQYRQWTASAPLPELVDRVRVVKNGSGESSPLELRWKAGAAEVQVLVSPRALAGKLIPQLARRYFYAGNEPEYDIVIEGGGLELYRSRPGAFAPEGSVGLFRVRSEELVLVPAAPVPPPPPPPPAPGGAESEASAPRQESPRQEPSRLRLLVRHRAGSLDSAAAAIYGRGRWLSLGALLLLGAGMVQLAVSSRRARRLAQLRMEFLAGVSHELRTPLAILCSAGENLADGIVAANGPEKAREYGRLIREESRRLSTMVEQLLDYAGSQSGRKRHVLRSIDPSGAVREAVASSLPAIREAGMQIEQHIPEALPQVRADAAGLRSAVENLLSNAVKYAASGRWIGVAIEATPDGREVRIAVSDRGSGIPADERSRVFEPFERGSGARNTRIRGAGIGLSLVKQMAEAHGGRVGLQSGPEGSRITLHLPALSREEA